MTRRPGRQEPTEPSRRGSYFGGGMRWIWLALVALVVALVIAILAMNLDEDEPTEPVRTITPEATSSRLPSEASPLLDVRPAV